MTTAFHKRLTTAVIGCVVAFVALQPVLKAETTKDHKQKAAGFLAQTLCSARVNEWPLSYQQQKAEYYRKVQPKAAAYLTDPQVMEAASILSLAMNSNCSGFDQSSSDFKRAVVILDRM